MHSSSSFSSWSSSSCAVAAALALSAAVLAVPQETPSPQEATATAETRAIDALLHEYELAYEAWSRASHGILLGNGPAHEFWPRFETLARGSEGRAVLWMLDNAPKGGDDAAGTRRQLFELVRSGGDAEWVAAALPRLGTKGIESDVLAHLRALQADARPKALRVAARLAEASFHQAKEPARAADLHMRAAFLQYLDVELAADEALASEDLEELTGILVEDLEKQQSEHFGRAYYMSADGDYYARAAGPVAPEKTWKPVVETLADKGCARARLWALENADWQLSKSERERVRGYLDAMCQGALTPEQIAALGNQTESLCSKLGLDFVEPRVRALVEKGDEASRPRLLFALGKSLCELGAKDPSASERGLALLRDVQTRWPSSLEAKSAEGQVFRFTNLVIGKVAPDFEAVDVDGNAFKLSDYKGKVTVVDFWGFW